MTDWKPGSTAPKDGTHILGYYKDFGRYVVQYDADEGWQDTCGDRDMREPDLWTELTPGPEGA